MQRELLSVGRCHITHIGWNRWPVRAIECILDSQGVWLVKKRKDTPGWSFHFPSSTAGQNTELFPPVTTWYSSWIRYLHVNTYKKYISSLTVSPNVYVQTKWLRTHSKQARTWYILFLQWLQHGCHSVHHLNPWDNRGIKKREVTYTQHRHECC